MRWMKSARAQGPMPAVLKIEPPPSKWRTDRDGVEEIVERELDGGPGDAKRVVVLLGDALAVSHPVRHGRRGVEERGRAEVVREHGGEVEGRLLGGVVVRSLRARPGGLRLGLVRLLLRLVLGLVVLLNDHIIDVGARGTRPLRELGRRLEVGLGCVEGGV